MFKSWIQDIECAIKDRNLNNEEALQLVKEFSEGCARDNINFYLEVTDNPSVDGLFKNLWQVFSSGEDGQQMLAKFYSRVQNSKESVKEFGESILQIARKIMMAKPEFKVHIDNTLKARFADGLRDHYHQAMAREMIHSHPTLSYVAYKSEVLKTLGPNAKPRSITTSKLETSDIESPPKNASANPSSIKKLMQLSRKIGNSLNVLVHLTQKQLLIQSSMQYKEIIKVVNQQVLLQSNLNHHNSMANHVNHNSFLVRMVH